MSELKEKIADACLKLLLFKKAELEIILNDIFESLENETKSSVGDKHETARARMQSEQEKAQIQLKELRSVIRDFETINLKEVHQSVKKGSLITSNKGLFFVGPALGKILVDGKTVFVISLSSPLGALLRGKKAGDEAELNGIIYNIKSVE